MIDGGMSFYPLNGGRVRWVAWENDITLSFVASDLEHAYEDAAYALRVLRMRDGAECN